MTHTHNVSFLQLALQFWVRTHRMGANRYYLGLLVEIICYLLTLFLNFPLALLLLLFFTIVNGHKLYR